MIDYLKQHHLSLLIVIYLVVVSFLGSSQSFGAAANLTTVGNPWSFTSTGSNNGVTLASTTATSFKVGQTGTKQANYITTTCSMIANSSIAATSTGYAYCTGVTGVTSSDYVLAQFSTSTTNTKMTDQFVIISAKASTTAGSIDFNVLNLSGTAAVPSAASKIGSTTAIRAGH